MNEKDNPFPADGDAGKIPKFTDFLICLREDRIEKMQTVILPILDNANLGEIKGSHDLVIVGEIGRGKTHLLKFLEKKLSGKKVRLVSNGVLEIPNYNNILPVYVKFDASMTMSPEMFGYFFINYLFGSGVKDFGILNNPALKSVSGQLKTILEKLYTQRTGQDLKIPQIIATQPAIDLMFEACSEVLKISQKKSVLFLFDELEGIILAAQRQKEESLTMVMDFLRQFHDSINREEATQEALYAAYAMTAPAFDKAEQARQESGAWLSRVRSQVIEIPQFSEEELKALISCALEHDDLLDVRPFNQDALAFIYRSVMGRPRDSIQAFHNSYDLWLREKAKEIGPRDVVRSTTWLNPDAIIDSNKVAKVKAEFGQRYSYLVQIFADNLIRSIIPMNSLIAECKKNNVSDVSKDKIINDLVKFGPTYVEVGEDGETVKVLQPFYKRILKEPEKPSEGTKAPIAPAKFIESSSETAANQVRTGKLTNDERLSRLTEALDRVLKQLFEAEGIPYLKTTNDWRVYSTKKGVKGDPIKILSKPLLSATINQAEIVDLLEKVNANSILLLYDFDDPVEEQKFRKRLQDTNLPEPYPWVKRLFKDSFAEPPDAWRSKQMLNNISKSITISQICVDRPVSYGKKTFRSSSGPSAQIDEKGLWYSITQMARLLDPEYSNMLEITLGYVIQDFFGSMRQEIVEKSSVQSKNLTSLLSVDARLVTMAKTLMRDPKCREAISKNQIIIFKDLPPGVNSTYMNKLSDSAGLFTRIGTDSWRANSLNDAQQYNPWIRFIIYNSTSGKLENEILDAARAANLGSFEPEVISCLQFYFELLTSLELMEKGQVKIVDSRVLLLQEIRKLKITIVEIKKKEFADAEQSLEKYVRTVEKEEVEIERIKKENLTKLEADSRFKDCLAGIAKIAGQIQQMVEETKEIVEEKHLHVEELMTQANEEHKKALTLIDTLDFNKSGSPIVKTIMKKQKLKPYILEIPLAIVPPHDFDKVATIKRELEQTYAGGFLMRFLSKYQSFEEIVSDSVNGARQIETGIKIVIETYTKEIERNYQKLLDIRTEFSPGPKNNISNMTLDSRNSLSDKRFVDSLIFAAQAKELLISYIEEISKKFTLAISEKKSALEAKSRRLFSYLENSLRLAEKKSLTISLSGFQKLENTSKDIRKKIDSFASFAIPDIRGKSTTEDIEALMKSQSSVVSKEQEIDGNLNSLNRDILQLNRSFFTESFGKALEFISKSGIDSLNYSEFVSYVGNENQAEEAIIELLKIGLVNMNTR